MLISEHNIHCHDNVVLVIIWFSTTLNLSSSSVGNSFSCVIFQIVSSKLHDKLLALHFIQSAAQLKHIICTSCAENYYFMLHVLVKEAMKV